MKCGVVGWFFGLVGVFLRISKGGRSCKKAALIVMEPRSFSKNWGLCWLKYCVFPKLKFM